jgi:hypothetical protein
MTTEKGVGCHLQNLPPTTATSASIVATSADQRARAVEQFGYTPRQAAFIALVAVHSGYFVSRQWLKFAGIAHGHRTVEFLRALVARGHAHTLRCSQQASVYHISSRAIYAAINEEHNRHRRQIQPSSITQKLMSLDVVLAFRDRVWLGTEREKVALFTEQFGLDQAILPAKKYYSRENPTDVTIRHFVEKWPIGLESPSTADPTVTLTYLNSGERTTAGFEAFLAVYRPLICRLPSAVVLYVSGGGDRGTDAQRVFDRHYGRGISRRAFDPAQLASHFKSRQRLETGYSNEIALAEINQLRADLSRFCGPTYDRLYHLWQLNGDAVLNEPNPSNAGNSSTPASSIARGPRLETYRMPFIYPVANFTEDSVA